MHEKVVIIGAGGSGRGFLARLLQKDGADICFLDKNKKLINELRRAGSYQIQIGTKKERIVIRDYEILNTDNPEAVDKVTDADWIFTSVGMEHLSELAGLLGKAAEKKREPLKLIPCENGISPKSILKNVLDGTAAENSHISQGIIFCTSIPEQQGSLDIVSEDFSNLPYDVNEGTFKLPFEHFQGVYKFEQLLQRKIYTYNCLSACIAYLGAYMNYEVYADAANDRMVQKYCEKLIGGLNKALCKTMQIEEEEQCMFAEQAMKKFSNREITDTIYKNVRAAVRKLSPTERIMGPMRLMEQAGEDTAVLQLVAAAALYYLEKKEPLIYKKKEYQTPEDLFRDENPQCGEQTVKQIFEILNQLRQGEILKGERK